MVSAFSRSSKVEPESQQQGQPARRHIGNIGGLEDVSGWYQLVLCDELGLFAFDRFAACQAQGAGTRTEL